MCKVKKSRLTSNFSRATLYNRRKRNNIFKKLKKRKREPRILCLQKLTFQSKGHKYMFVSIQ